MAVSGNGKYGTRKGPRLVASDYYDAIALSEIVRCILDKHGAVLGIPLTHDYPEVIDIPSKGEGTARNNGIKLMNYTLKASRMSYAILHEARIRCKFKYSIEAVPKKLVTIYHSLVSIRGQAPTTCVHIEYLRALMWVMVMLEESLESRN